MNQSIVGRKAVLAIGIAILFSGLLSCEYRTARKMLRENPLHKDNIPEKPACPIDGLWKEAYYGYEYGVEKGRMFTAHEIMLDGHDMSWPMVWVRDIVRVGPGKYVGRQLGPDNTFSKPCTLSVVGEDKLVTVIGNKVEELYNKVQLDNEEWFLSDYHLARRETIRQKEEAVAGSQSDALAATKRTNIPSIQIHRAEVRPQRVTTGSKFDLIVDFTVADPSAKVGRLPVRFSYRILRGQKALFNSKPVALEPTNGKRTPRIVHLTAAKKKGTYTIEVYLDYMNKRRTDAVDLIIQ